MVLLTSKCELNSYDKLSAKLSIKTRCCPFKWICVFNTTLAFVIWMSFQESALKKNIWIAPGGKSSKATVKVIYKAWKINYNTVRTTLIKVPNEKKRLQISTKSTVTSWFTIASIDVRLGRFHLLKLPTNIRKQLNIVRHLYSLWCTIKVLAIRGL